MAAAAAPAWAAADFVDVPEDARAGLFVEDAAALGELLKTVRVPCAGGWKPVEFRLGKSTRAMHPRMSPEDIAHEARGEGMREFLGPLLRAVAEGQHSSLPSAFRQAPDYHVRLARFLRAARRSFTLHGVRANRPWTRVYPTAAKVGVVYWACLEFTLAGGRVVRVRGLLTIGQSASSIYERILGKVIGHAVAFRNAVEAVTAVEDNVPPSASGGTIHAMLAWCVLAGFGAEPSFTGARVTFFAAPCGETLSNWGMPGQPSPRDACSKLNEALATAMAYGWAQAHGFEAGFGASAQASGAGGFLGRIVTVPVPSRLRELLVGAGGTRAKRCPALIPALLVQLAALELPAAAVPAAADGGGGGAAAAVEVVVGDGPEDFADPQEEVGVGDEELEVLAEAAPEGAGPAPPAPPEARILFGLLRALHSLRFEVDYLEPTTPGDAMMQASTLLGALCESLLVSSGTLNSLLPMQQLVIDLVAAGVRDAVATRLLLVRLAARDYSPLAALSDGAVAAAACALLEALDAPVQVALALPAFVAPLAYAGAAGESGWLLTLRWLVVALGGLVASGGPSLALVRGAAPPNLGLHGTRLIELLRRLFEQHAAAVDALVELSHSDILSRLRAVFARGHEAVLELCWAAEEEGEEEAAA